MKFKFPRCIIRKLITPNNYLLTSKRVLQGKKYNTGIHVHCPSLPKVSNLVIKPSCTKFLQFFLLYFFFCAVSSSVIKYFFKNALSPLQLWTYSFQYLYIFIKKCFRYKYFIRFGYLSYLLVSLHILFCYFATKQHISAYNTFYKLYVDNVGMIKVIVMPKIMNRVRCNHYSNDST